MDKTVNNWNLLSLNLMINFLYNLISINGYFAELRDIN